MTTTERPIIFSAESVRAILQGRKTQTRRVLKLPTEQDADVYFNTILHEWRWIERSDNDRGGPLRCPFGAVGDRLWVKETWHALEIGDAYATAYRADMPPGSEKYDRWNSPIHMPRWASRLTLEITEVRVERVQAIGEVAARAEGVDREAWPEDITNDDATLNAECGYFPPRFYVAGFARRWDALNARRSGGAFSWQRNPWVWSISFRQLS